MKHIVLYILCAVVLTSCTDFIEGNKAFKQKFITSQKTKTKVSVNTPSTKELPTYEEVISDNLVSKVAYLITHSPEEWERKYDYNRDCRYTRLSHISGVVITMIKRRKDHSTKWSDADSEGWSFTKPTSSKLTVKENREIDDAYYGWYELSEKDAREIILNKLDE